MAADQYLYGILAKETVDTSASSPLRQVAVTLMPRLRVWAGDLLVGVHPSGSFAKGTANASGTDIDLFLSLRSDTTATLKDIYDRCCQSNRNQSPIGAAVAGWRYA